MRRHYAVVLCALLLLVGIGAMAAASTHHAGGDCFPAAKWDASDGLRPCVQVTGVEEDGSFRFRVSDANGTERYTLGVGALDR